MTDFIKNGIAAENLPENQYYFIEKAFKTGGVTDTSAIIINYRLNLL